MAEKNAADVERGIDASRRRFLGGTALAALGAIIGDVVPLSDAQSARCDPMIAWDYRATTLGRFQMTFFVSAWQKELMFTSGIATSTWQVISQVSLISS